MTQDSRVFEGRDHSEAELAEIWGDFAYDGVFDHSAANPLVVTAPGGMTVNVAAGRANIQGFWYKNDATVGLAIAANPTGLTRFDLVVIRLDRAANNVVLAIRQGVAGSGLPALQRAVGGAWELCLAQITVGAGVSNIAAGNLTDTRNYPTLCGVAQRRNMLATLGMNGIARFVGFDGDEDSGIGNPTADSVEIRTGGISRINVSNTTVSVTPDFQVSRSAANIFSSIVMSDGNYGQIWMLNQGGTKQGAILLGTAASQGLGNSGDLSIYTAGTGSGRVILGSNSTPRAFIGNDITFGPNVITGHFVIKCSTQAVGGGVRIVNSANDTQYVEQVYNSGGDLSVNNSGGKQWRFASAGDFIVDSGGLFVVNGAMAGFTSRNDGFNYFSNHPAHHFGIKQITDGALGAGIRLTTAASNSVYHEIFLDTGGNMTWIVSGVGRHIVWADGQTWWGGHSQPFTSGVYNLGASGLRWATVFCGGVNANAASTFTSLALAGAITGVTALTASGQGTFGSIVSGGINSSTDQTYDLGAAGNRWRQVHVRDLTIYNTVNATGVGAVGIGSAGNPFGVTHLTQLMLQTTTTGFHLQLGFDSAAKPSTSAWTVSSDERVKVQKSIRPYTTGLDAIVKLHPIFYRYNGLGGTPRPSDDEEDSIGFLAHEVQEVAPEMVRTISGKLREKDKEETDLLYVNTHAFTHMSVNAFKEIAERLAKTEAELARLREQVEGRGN